MNPILIQSPNNFLILVCFRGKVLVLSSSSINTGAATPLLYLVLVLIK